MYKMANGMPPETINDVFKLKNETLLSGFLKKLGNRNHLIVLAESAKLLSAT